VGTSQINSLASSGFTEQHALSSELSEEQHSQQSSKQQRRQPTSTTSRPAIAINRRTVTSRAPPQASQNASGVHTECVNKSTYHLQPSIKCGSSHRRLKQFFSVCWGYSYYFALCFLIGVLCSLPLSMEIIPLICRPPRPVTGIISPLSCFLLWVTSIIRINCLHLPLLLYMIVICCFPVLRLCGMFCLSNVMVRLLLSGADPSLLFDNF
jgi:hypothetical protein